MKEIKYIIAGTWIAWLSFPVFIIIYKLSDYLLNTPFKEWHVTILWTLISPITLIIIFMIKDNKEDGYESIQDFMKRREKYEWQCRLTYGILLLLTTSWINSNLPLKFKENHLQSKLSVVLSKWVVDNF